MDDPSQVLATKADVAELAQLVATLAIAVRAIAIPGTPDQRNDFARATQELIKDTGLLAIQLSRRLNGTEQSDG